MLIVRFVPRRCKVSINSPFVDVGGNIVFIKPCVDTVDTDCVANENGAVVVDVDEIVGCASSVDCTLVIGCAVLEDCVVAASING